MKCGEVLAWRTLNALSCCCVLEEYLKRQTLVKSAGFAGRVVEVELFPVLFMVGGEVEKQNEWKKDRHELCFCFCKPFNSFIIMAKKNLFI